MIRKNRARTACRIVARGELDDGHAPDYFEGMRVESEDGRTILTGVIVDQSHLIGMLDRVDALGLELLSVHTPPEDADHHGARRRREP